MLIDKRPLFDEVWNYGDPAGTRTRFMALWAEAGEAEATYKIELMTQIARTYGLEGNFDEAHRWLDQAEVALQPKLAVAHVRYLLERGRAFNSDGDKVRAYELFEAAFEAAEIAEATFYAIDAAHMLALAAAATSEKMAWHEKGIAMAEASTDRYAQRWLGSLYNNLGWLYHDESQYDKALAIFEKAQRWFEVEAEPRPERITIARWSVARVLRSLGRVPEALAVQEALLAEAGGVNEDGYVYEELAECLLLLNRVEAARSYFGKAYAQLSQDRWLVQHEPTRLERLKQLWQND